MNLKILTNQKSYSGNMSISCSSSSSSKIDDNTIIASFWLPSNILVVNATSLLIIEEEETTQQLKVHCGARKEKGFSIDSDIELPSAGVMEESVYNEFGFIRRLRLSRNLFYKVYNAIMFLHDGLGQLCLHPFVRTVACFRHLAYVDTFGRNDEYLRLRKSKCSEFLKAFCPMFAERFDFVGVKTTRYSFRNNYPSPITFITNHPHRIRRVGLSGYSLLLSLFLLLITLGSSNATNHTNQCITKLGGILTCNSGVVKNLAACCDGIRELIRKKCDCNPMINNLLGTQGQLLFKLAPVCRLRQPLKWRSVPTRLISSNRCDATKTFNYGCAPLSDNKIDAKRFETVTAFGKLFNKYINATGCFNTNEFVQDMSTVFQSDNATFYVPYGIGSFKGFVHMAEYLAIAFRTFTHDYWWFGVEPVDPSKPARLEVTQDGLTWYAAQTQSGSFLRGADAYKDVYIENYFVFEQCETKIILSGVSTNEGMAGWVEGFVQAAQLSKRWGIIDICKYHTKYCSTSDKTRQYQTEQECLDYMNSLPVWTPACGKNRPLTGHSLTCKFKHHFMVPSHPELHCAHIGKAGVVDMDGIYKCDDVAECTIDEGQDEWSPLQKIGDNIPIERQVLFDQNNLGYESEALPCVIPYNATSRVA